jgi:hypothetical protein
MHQNEVFLFFKIIFDISTSKRSENIKKIILSKKQFQNFWERRLHCIPKHSLHQLTSFCGNLIKKKIIDCSSKSGLLTSLITIKNR